MKRLFDFLASAGGLALTWPLFAVVAALIKINDGGSVFFRQKRVGLRGQPFDILKFRTMIEHAERRGPQITGDGDARITHIGRWLRKSKLDELPQLINVLRGEMSLVGPRPEVPKYVALYSPQQRRVLQCRPGITDPASLEFFGESELLGAASNQEQFYVAHIMPEKLRINLEYIDRATLFTDLAIIMRTVLRVAGWRSPGQARLPENLPDRQQAA